MNHPWKSEIKYRQLLKFAANTPWKNESLLYSLMLFLKSDENNGVQAEMLGYEMSGNKMQVRFFLNEKLLKNLQKLQHDINDIVCTIYVNGQYLYFETPPEHKELDYGTKIVRDLIWSFLNNFVKTDGSLSQNHPSEENNAMPLKWTLKDEKNWMSEDAFRYAISLDRQEIVNMLNHRHKIRAGKRYHADDTVFDSLKKGLASLGSDTVGFVSEAVETSSFIDRIIGNLWQTLKYILIEPYQIKQLVENVNRNKLLKKKLLSQYNQWSANIMNVLTENMVHYKDYERIVQVSPNKNTDQTERILTGKLPKKDVQMLLNDE